MADYGSIISGVIVACLWLPALLVTYRVWRPYLILKSVPWLKTSEATLGMMVRMQGVASLGADPPQTSFLAKLPCAYYYWYVIEYYTKWVADRSSTPITDDYPKRGSVGRTKSGRRKTDSQFVLHGSGAPFFLKDDHGDILIRPRSPDIFDIMTAGHESVFHKVCTKSDPLYYGVGPKTDLPDSQGKRLIEEKIIPVNQQTAVFGLVRQGEGQSGLEIVPDGLAGGPQAEKLLATGLVNRFYFVAFVACCWLFFTAWIAAGFGPWSIRTFLFIAVSGCVWAYRRASAEARKINDESVVSERAHQESKKADAIIFKPAALRGLIWKSVGLLFLCALVLVPFLMRRHGSSAAMHAETATAINYTDTGLRATPIVSDLPYADFSTSAISMRQMGIQTAAAFSYNGQNPGCWRITARGGGFNGTFNLTAGGQYTVVVTHLTSYFQNCPGQGYSPVTLQVNGRALAADYDPSANHGGAHALVTDKWSFTGHPGQNSIRITAGQLCSLYWIQRVEIRQ